MSRDKGRLHQVAASEIVVEPEPTSIAAAERIMFYWQKIGFEVDLIKGDQPGDALTDSEWDMCYRRVRMEEPLLELWPLLANDNSLDITALGCFLTGCDRN